VPETAPPDESLHAFVRSCLARVGGDFTDDAVVEECIRTHEDLWRMLHGLEPDDDGEVGG
jgi:hypothetical protein